MAQTTCFCERRCLWARTIGDAILGKYAQKPLKVGVNRQIQAKTRKSKNRTISETVNLIKPKFEDIAATIIYTAWMVYHYQQQIQHGWQPPSWKSLWRHNWAADTPIWMKFGSPTQNHMPMTMKISKWKPEIQFQYGGRLFLETGNSNISAANWATLSIFSTQADFDVLNCNTSSKRKLRLVPPQIFPSCWKFQAFFNYMLISVNSVPSLGYEIRILVTPWFL